MPRYFIQLSYKGTHFKGYQVQPNQITVQGELEKALTTLHQQSIEVVGCGRTDTGVHASDYFIHADLPKSWELDHLVFKMNCLLNKDIAVSNVVEVIEEGHARFSATRRSYHYFIHEKKNPFLTETSWLLKQGLDLDKMNQAAKHLLGTQDFSSFCKAGSDVTHHMCDVSACYFERIGEGQIRLTISANRFLRNMVRAAVGTLVEVGLNRIEPQMVKQIIESKNRSKAGASAPAEGLFLCDIQYPKEIFKTV